MDVYDSRAYESVWVQVPDDWGSWRVALLIMDVSSGRTRSESTSDLARQFDRFIEARLADAKALSDEPVEEAEAPANPYADLLEGDAACQVAAQWPIAPPPPPPKFDIPTQFIGRFSKPPRDIVLRGIHRLDGESIKSLPSAYSQDRKFGVEQDKWMKVVVQPGSVVGPTGCGPCVGLLLIPKPWNSSLPVFAYHFGPYANIRSGLRRSGAIEPVIFRHGVGYLPLPGYEAVLSGGSNETDGSGRGNLRGVIQELKRLNYPIRAYLPTVAMYVDHMGNIYCGMPESMKHTRKYYKDDTSGIYPVK